MFATSLLPELPASLPEIIVYVSAYIGIVLLAYAIFIEQEHRQDLVRSVGAAGLLSYGILIENGIIVFAMAVIILFSFIEFIEIILGLHTHNKEDLKKYKKLWRITKK